MEFKELLRFIEDNKGKYFAEMIAENKRLREEKEQRRKEAEKEASE